MIRASKKLFLFSTVFVCVLMITLGMNGSLVCYAANQEYSSKSIGPQKALTIFKDVVGLDMAKYRTNLDSYTQDLYFETLPQENVKYTLQSDESKLELICTFANEKLRSMSVYILKGLPHMTQQVTNTLEMAKDFINKYQTYSGASYFETLGLMLNTVEANKNVTKISGNAKLEVAGIGTCASYRWTYMFNGVEAPSKCVALYFEQGFLNVFVDTWNLYKIGSTDISISEGEAVKIAMERAKNFSWKVSMGGDNPPVEVKEFNIVGVNKTTLDFGNYISKKDARGGDPLTLYPGWRIYLYFDKLYPGNVYGVNVGIWADTGEVNDIRTMLLLGDYSSNGDLAGNEDSIGQSNNVTGPTLPPIAWIALPVLIAIALGETVAYYKRKKMFSYKRYNMPKSNSLRLGALLCLLISLITFSMAMPAVQAGTHGIISYGSRWNMVDTEKIAAQDVIANINYWFSTYAGYTCYNAYGSPTQRQYVFDHAEAMEANFDHVAMFHHGHAGKDYVQGVLHWDYFDDDGYTGNPNDQIWDYEVYPYTWRSKTFFVILWACRQGDLSGYMDGNGRAVGMPYAWHHPVDPSGDCFIGFKDASMPLTQTSVHNDYITYEYWLIRFLYHASRNHYTIWQALNQASLDYFNRNYPYTELNYGFYAYWPNIGSGWGYMKIYGNYNIYLY